MNTYEPLHHKYRPQIFADLVGQGAIADTLTNAINRQRIAPAYLFTGPRGTGKTSSARILAKSLNCISSDRPTPIPCGQCEVCRAIAVGSALDVIEIDAASNTGVDNIREIIERAQFAPVQCRYKVYVIDECHMLSVAAFNALLKTLEEPPDRVIFVLATTDPQRVLPTIISRCQRFDYRRIPLEDMVKHLEMIAQKESIQITLEAVTLVAQIANGGLRDAESLLDQLSLLSETITPEKVWDLVGAVPEQDLLKLIQAIQSDKAEAVLESCRHLMNRGREPLVVLQNLAGFYLNLLIAKTSPNRSDLVAVTSPTWDALCQEVQHWSVENILRGQKHLKESELQLKNTTQPRLWLEVTLLGLLPSANVIPTVVVNQATVSQAPISEQKNVSTRSIPQNNPASPAPSSSQTVVSSPSQPPQVSQPSQVSPISPHPVATNDLNSVWEALLGYLPPFTASLIQQQGHLVDLQENAAYISFKTEPLLKMAKPKVKELETAFQRVCQRTIKVHLQVGLTAVITDNNHRQNNTSQVTSVEAKTHQNDASQVTVSSDSITRKSDISQEKISPSPIKNQPKTPSQTSQKTASPAVNTVKSTSKVSQPESVSPVIDSPLTEINDQELKTVISDFAKVFNGEVIKMSYPEDEITEDKNTIQEDLILENSQVTHINELESPIDVNKNTIQEDLISESSQVTHINELESPIDVNKNTIQEDLISENSQVANINDSESSINVNQNTRIKGRPEMIDDDEDIPF